MSERTMISFAMELADVSTIGTVGGLIMKDCNTFRNAAGPCSCHGGDSRWTGLRSGRKASKRIYDTLSGLRPFKARVILIVLGAVSEQRVARLLCRCEMIHLVGLRRSLVSF
jgi:hypothetical protein